MQHWIMSSVNMFIWIEISLLLILILGAIRRPNVLMFLRAVHIEGNSIC